MSGYELKGSVWQWSAAVRTAAPRMLLLFLKRVSSRGFGGEEVVDKVHPFVVLLADGCAVNREAFGEWTPSEMRVCEEVLGQFLGLEVR